MVRHQNARLSYRELKDRVEETARGLVGLGLEPGDRLGVWASSCVEWVLLFLACARTGIVQVKVNLAYRSQDLGFVLRKSKIKALFLHSRDARADYRQILEETMAGQQLPLERVVYLDKPSWTRMLQTVWTFLRPKSNPTMFVISSTPRERPVPPKGCF